jgi:protein-S-isoprenylcysteine O-methyltransferase Ste14
VAAALSFIAPGKIREAWMPLFWGIQALSILLALAAMQVLGRQWRLQAVVTDDHELITSGPYRWVRHPVYLSLLGMVATTSFAHCDLLFVGLIVVIFIVGTEVRVRIEDRLILEAFGERARRYQQGTSAYLPLIR